VCRVLPCTDVFGFLFHFFCVLALAPSFLVTTTLTDSNGVPTASLAAPIMAVAFDAVAVVASSATDAAVHNPVSTALVIGGAALILAPRKRGRPTKASILQASATVAQAATEGASASSGPVKKKQKIQAQLLISVVLLKSGQSYVQWTGMERKGRGKGLAEVPLSSFRFEELCTSPLEFDKREPVMQLYEISDDEVHADVVQSVAFDAEGSRDSDEYLPLELDNLSAMEEEVDDYFFSVASVYARPAGTRT
jgi:hypothetical protein